MFDPCSPAAHSDSVSAVRLGFLDPSEFLSLLDQSDDTAWNQKTYRNELKQFRQTRSLFIQGDPETPFNLSPDCPIHQPHLYRALAKTLEFFSTYGLTQTCKILAGELAPGGTVELHRDPKHYRSLRRFHWVLKTNENCQMIFRRERHHFASGELWYFNNMALHAAENKGQTERIHVIFDFINQPRG